MPTLRTWSLECLCEDCLRRLIAPGITGSGTALEITRMHTLDYCANSTPNVGTGWS